MPTSVAMSQLIRMSYPENLGLTDAARRDIAAILRYTGSQWGTAQVERYRKRIERALALVCESPGLGHEADGIPANHLLFAFGSHSLIYTVRGNRIVIVRILHQRMNHRNHL